MNLTENRFRTIVFITGLTVYFLILVGGIVRTTGSGMGCPDWPKCYGRWIPPVHVSQLPSDYKNRYKHLGKVADFNVVHTWIEYINRLVGILTGFLVLVTFIFSLKYKEDKKVKYYCFIVLLLILIEGIIGKFVVSTNLKPLIISIHMWMAIVIILLLVYVWTKVSCSQFVYAISIKRISKIYPLAILLFFATIVQSILGSNVRQYIDEISNQFNMQHRESWLNYAGNNFIIHRFFSWIIFGIHIYLFYTILISFPSKHIRQVVYLLSFLVLLEMLLGVTMSWFSIPAFAQPLHMLVAVLLLSTQFYLLLMFWTKKRRERILT